MRKDKQSFKPNKSKESQVEETKNQHGNQRTIQTLGEEGKPNKCLQQRNINMIASFNEIRAIYYR